MPKLIRIDGSAADLSGRFVYSTTVAGSPAAATETTVATVTVTDDVVMQSAVWLEGFAAFTVGTNGVTANLKLKRSTTILAATGLLTVVAATLVAFSVQGVDTAPTLPGQAYTLTLTIGSGSAASTVSACFLGAIVV